MNFAAIAPATNWFFVHETSEGVGKKYVVHPLAVWALNAQGEVIGLVAVNNPARRGTTTASLGAPPPVKGEYIYRDKLSYDMQECLRAQTNHISSKNP